MPVHNLRATPMVQLIDWREQFAKLHPFLSQHGGVVHIRTSDSPPESIFTKALKHQMLTGVWPRSWRIVQFDSVRAYDVAEMVRQFQQALELPVPDEPAEPAIAINVAKDIRARIVTIHDVTVRASFDYESRYHLDSQIRQLREEILSQADVRRLAVIFVNSHDHALDTLHNFRRQLWDATFEHCIAAGLLLIDIGHGARDVE